MDYLKEYKKWCESDEFDKDTKEELLKIKGDEKEILNDLEYLQQTYPGEVRRCQRRIAEILDKYDYEGSMIYDEYPDRLSLFRIADTISTILEQEAEKVSKDLIHVLVCNEIYKRRHGGRRGMIAFL